MTTSCAAPGSPTETPYPPWRRRARWPSRRWSRAGLDEEAAPMMIAMPEDHGTDGQDAARRPGAPAPPSGPPPGRPGPRRGQRPCCASTSMSLSGGAVMSVRVGSGSAVSPDRVGEISESSDRRLPRSSTSHGDAERQPDVPGDLGRVLEEAPATWPPPPKPPQSISSPRAHADEIPMMKATNSRRGHHGHGPGQQAEHEAPRPRPPRRAGAHWPTVGTTDSGSRS